MKKFLLLLVTIFAHKAVSQITFSENSEDISTQSIEHLVAPKLNSFAEAASWADVVAIAQVDSVDYQQVRNLNAKGYAYLNILIPYKGSKKDEPISVIATGFEDNACYYPDGFNEGERYLVFLKKAPETESNVYYGFKPYCQMQVLLSELGQYILRTPLDTDNIQIDESLIEDHKFNDQHAMLDTTLWTSISRNEYAKKFACKIIESEDEINKYFHLRYTQGVPIYQIRPLLELDYKARITSKQM
ncbi:MAG: hypothetical protein AB8B80_06975 [Marinicellaceae bacterium]